MAFSGTGAGTAGDPYIITTLTQLNEVRDDLTAYYELANDINAVPTSAWDGGSGWDSIGDISNPFTGQFDGKGYTIDGLVINRPATAYMAFIAEVDGGTIQNVRLTNISVNGSGVVGTLLGKVGENSASTVQYCMASGTLTCEGSNGGGLIGVTQSPTGTVIQECYADVDVDVTIAHSGGFIGQSIQSTGTIQNCFALGDVGNTKNANNTGGFIGTLRQVGTLTISNCYSVGSVSGALNEGGFCGNYDSSGTLTTEGLFWDKTTSGLVGSPIGTGKTTTEMQQEATFTGYNFTTVWDIYEDNWYPYLQWANTAPSASFTVSETTTEIETTLQFTDTSTDAETTIVSWAWTFGDGGTSTSQNPTHEYTQNGTYTVTLTVTDTVGATDQATTTITVKAPELRLSAILSFEPRIDPQRRVRVQRWKVERGIDGFEYIHATQSIGTTEEAVTPTPADQGWWYVQNRGQANIQLGKQQVSADGDALCVTLLPGEFAFFRANSDIYAKATSISTLEYWCFEN